MRHRPVVDAGCPGPVKRQFNTIDTATQCQPRPTKALKLHVPPYVTCAKASLEHLPKSMCAKAVVCRAEAASALLVLGNAGMAALKTPYPVHLGPGVGSTDRSFPTGERRPEWDESVDVAPVTTYPAFAPTGDEAIGFGPVNDDCGGAPMSAGTDASVEPGSFPLAAFERGQSDGSRAVAFGHAATNGRLEECGGNECSFPGIDSCATVLARPETEGAEYVRSRARHQMMDEKIVRIGDLDADWLRYEP